MHAWRGLRVSEIFLKGRASCMSRFRQARPRMQSCSNRSRPPLALHRRTHALLTSPSRRPHPHPCSLPRRLAAAPPVVSLLQQTLGLNLKPVLALGGVGGIAAGFASQQILQNLVSGGRAPPTSA
jgi:hypothetical protein